MQKDVNNRNRDFRSIVKYNFLKISENTNKIQKVYFKNNKIIKSSHYGMFSRLTTLKVSIMKI